MNEEQLRVCLVAPVPPPYGGIGHWTLLVSRYAKTQTGIHIHTVNIAPRWRSVDDIRILKRVIGGGLQLVRDCLQVLAHLSLRPHVLHLTTSGSLAVIRDLVIMRIAQLFGVPVIYHTHFGRIPEIAGGASQEWRLISRAMNLAHTVMTIDATTAEAIRRHIPTVRVIQVPNCIDLCVLPEPPNRSSNAHTALFLGWVIPTKGIEELIQAWTDLQPSGWRLIIVGPGSKKYQQEIFSRYHPQGVEFLGERPHGEALKLMSEADLFVLPSYTEGFPNVVLEAMALGKPIVATSVGAIPEMLQQQCGLLIEPQKVVELKKALEIILSSKDLRISLGSRARDRATQCFSLEAIFPKLKEAWQCAAEL